MTLETRKLRYFIAIADAGAMSRAAAALSVAQSALSHHIVELEKELGIKLLDRQARGIALTAAGRRLYEHASAIVAALDKAEMDIKTFTEVASGPVSVGLCPTVVEAISLELMQAVRKSCPQVHLTIVEGMSPNLMERVLLGELCLAAIYNPPRDSRLASQPILDEELYLVGRPDLIGQSSQPIAFADIPERAIVGLNSPPGSRALIQAQILRNQIRPSPALEIASLSALRKALRGGLGCSILARATVAADLAEGLYHARRIVRPTLTRTLHILALADRPQPRAFVEVKALLADVISGAVNAGAWQARLVSRRGPAEPSDFQNADIE
jgi:LysR family nitrogen assimilation transcriptional regulator